MDIKRRIVKDALKRRIIKDGCKKKNYKKKNCNRWM